ncbi:hypothetical protein ACFZAR_19605 [Streptomyces sp. NPDC008222]|uniref:hypothetical protein n=1 Tax=Streptomyces sp. NPDC008222 TaxID=3364820 RepID=UPI0036E30812
MTAPLGRGTSPRTCPPRSPAGRDTVPARRETGVSRSAPPSDVVITMGCGDACPVFPGKRYLDWQLGGPAGQGIEAVRPIRDAVQQRVRAPLAALGIPASV